MPFRENAPDKRVHFLRLLRRRGTSSADGPDRFVSNDDTVEVRGCQPGQTPDNLLFDRIEGLSLIALFKCFADTNDDTQSGGQPSVCFLADNLIDLKKVLSPFGMPDNHMRATGIVTMKAATSPVNAPSLRSLAQFCAATLMFDPSKRSATLFNAVKTGAMTTSQWFALATSGFSASAVVSESPT